MRVLVPLVRAACDERFNLHGVQATTHFAAPLIVVNGPVRTELGFWCRQNVFSNVARANSTLGRAFQLILLNLGGARPDTIDMSTLGNPGKFSFCIAENEEENPWPPLHVDRGLPATASAVTLFAGEPPHGVSEHTSRSADGVGKALCAALATAWSHRTCVGREAFVVLCPEHVKTIHRDGWSKERLREFLFENTGVPVRLYREDGGEGTQHASDLRRGRDRRRTLLPQVHVAVVDSHRRRGRDRGEVLSGDRQLVYRAAGESVGDLRNRCLRCQSACGATVLVRAVRRVLWCQTVRRRALRAREHRENVNEDSTCRSTE